MSIVEAEEHKGAAPTLGSAPSQPQRSHAWQHLVCSPVPATLDSFLK